MLEILGYSDKITTRPGDTLEIKVSCEAGAKTFNAELVRIICADDFPGGAGYKVETVAHESNRAYPGRRQVINVGSSIQVNDAQGTLAPPSFTLQAFIYPTTPAHGVQGILGRFCDKMGGYRLMIDAQGALTLEIVNDGEKKTISSGIALKSRIWHFVAATFDAETGEVNLYQETGSNKIVHTEKISLTPAIPSKPFLIADGKYNGRIDSPHIFPRALTRREMDTCSVAEALAAWDFSIGISTADVTDASGNNHHGQAINLPTRGICGRNWTGEFMSWQEKPQHYGAIHFHDDDLYDACWETDFTLTLPDNLPSGIYAVRLSCAPSIPEHADEAEAFVTFFVSPSLRKATAPVAFLASTATYLAYANSHHGWRDPLAEICYNMALQLGPTEQFLQSRPDLGLSTYDVHSDGSPSYYSSRLRPVVNLRPKHRVWNFGADTHILNWLHMTGQTVDIITDDDLHEKGTALLKPYRTIITGTHPEYHTHEMLRAIKAYVDDGGRLMYVGGNGFYWHTAYHSTLPGVIEVRRAENGSRTQGALPGEYHMSFNGRMGGLWCNLGFAPQKLVGIGYGSTGFDSASYYRRQPGSFDLRAAFIFEGIGADEKIGDFGSVMGGAAGYELDMIDHELGTPEETLVLASSEGHSNAYVLTPERLLCAYPGIDGISHSDVRADMVFFSTIKRGAVFSTGSITWAGSLAHNKFDNNVARITGNVLKRFLDPKPF